MHLGSAVKKTKLTESMALARRGRVSRYVARTTRSQEVSGPRQECGFHVCSKVKYMFWVKDNQI